MTSCAGSPARTVREAGSTRGSPPRAWGQRDGRKQAHLTCSATAATLRAGHYSGQETTADGRFRHYALSVCRMGARFSPLIARHALLQMLGIVEHFSGVMSQEPPSSPPRWSRQH